MERTSSEQEIFDLFRDPVHKEEGFRLLMQRIQQRLYNMVYRITGSHADTDDVLQETLLKVYLNADKFNGKSSFFTWIYRIAVNESLNFLKKRKRFVSQDLKGGEIWFGDNQSEEDGPSGTEIQDLLQKAIIKLPEKQRLVFNLRYFEEVNYREMSEMLSTSEGALKASFHHAVRKIEQQLFKK